MNHIQLLVAQIERRIGKLSAEETGFVSHSWQTYEGAADLAQAIAEQRIECKVSVPMIRSDRTQVDLYYNNQRQLRLA